MKKQTTRYTAAAAGKLLFVCFRRSPLALIFRQNGVLASVSIDPRLRASKRPFDSEICGLRVTMSGDAVACGDGAGGAGCERQPFARQADRLKVRRGVVDCAYLPCTKI